MQGHPHQRQEPGDGTIQREDRTILSLLPPLDPFATKRPLKEVLDKPITYAPKTTFHLESSIVARMRETTPVKPAPHVGDEDKSLMGLTIWAIHGKYYSR